METTIKVTKETKDRILKLDLSEKGKSFDHIVNDLITFYQKSNKKYTKDYKEWEKSFSSHKKQMIQYNKDKTKFNSEKKMWDRLLIWAKKEGFKG
jgi:hypothetical protein|tara:strand:+ start:5426 stop:5710 length:285 start_codon:yes stop_codon:yes gene_type:complete